MKLTYSSGKMSVEIEGDTQRDLFEKIGAFQEVFGIETCGKCGGNDLKFTVRTVNDDQYYELRCGSCGAKLAFGCNKKGGGLFPKRKDSENNWLPDNGWVKYNKTTGKEE